MFPQQQTKPVALVTGGAKRIGRRICLTLAHHGWRVAIHYRQSRAEAQLLVDELRQMSIESVAIAADLSRSEDTGKLVQEVVSHFGQIDAVINNAALFEYDSAASISAQKLEQHIQINLLTPILLAQRLYDSIPDGKMGCVVNLLDQKLFNLNPDFFSYTLSKSALQTATTMMAMALAPKLRIVGIAPGLSLMSGDQTESNFLTAHTKTVLNKSSTPEDIANTVLFALGCQAITGSVIVVDGGQHLVPLARDVMFVVD
jgi:NAD(P)-dependent dehydrogenase (short-subunit alcohol dehydrogenase family)